MKSPKVIRFSQNSVRSFVDGSENLDDLIAKMKAGVDIDEIRLVRFGDLPDVIQAKLSKQGVPADAVFTLDNRRLHAAKKANVNIKTRFATVEELEKVDLQRRFSTENGGKSVEVR